MVDKETRRSRIKESLEKLRERGITPASLGKRLMESGLPHPETRQAIHKWFKTGAVDDKYLAALAYAARVDLDHLQLYGEFRPPRPTAPEEGHDIAFDIYAAALNLPEPAQEALLNLLEIMSSLQTVGRHARKRSTAG